jgi:hypothetical protein
MMAFWENVWSKDESGRIKQISDENAVYQRTNYLSELKNIEQDIREISMT